MREDNGKDTVLIVLTIAFLFMFFLATHMDNCRDAVLDGANVTWKNGLTGCYVEVDIDGTTKQITPMQWYRFVEGE